MSKLLASPIWFAFSGILFAASIVFFALGGLKLGIDFTGGSILQVAFTETRPEITELAEFTETVVDGEVLVQPTGAQSAIIRTETLGQETRHTLLDELSTQYGSVDEESFSSIGPTIGEELREKAIYAIVAVLIAIILYISWAFRSISKGPVPSWAYGVGAIVALVHDIVLTTGVFAALGYFADVQIDALFATALLTILGFSVHDTIVVYDRVRHRIKKFQDEPFETTVRESIKSTAVRSLNTSITTLMVLAALVLFGGASIQWFLVALIVGVVLGTYSSIFIASPLLVVLRNVIRR